MDGYVENCNVSGVHGYMSSHTISQQNGLKQIINWNNRYYIEMNADLNHFDLRNGIGLINSHALYQFN